MEKLLERLKAVINCNGYKNEFSLNDASDESVCLIFNDNIWDVFNYDRGNKHELKKFLTCSEACIDVLYRLSDSKEDFEKMKQQFLDKSIKVFNPDLWKPINFKTVDVPDVCIGRRHNGFVEYQVPTDRYEVRGIMPSASETIAIKNNETLEYEYYQKIKRK